MRRGNPSAPPRVSRRQEQRDAEAQLSRLGLVLAVLAVAANGCVQPDEWFQSVEIAARDVFGAKIWTPWEFGGSAALGDAVHEPCRSVSFPAVAAHAPLFLLRLCGGSIAWPRLIMMIPRLWALVISILVHDRLLGEVWRAAGLDDEGVRVARALRRTSWACLVLETRPFSNVYETFGLARTRRGNSRSPTGGGASAPMGEITRRCVEVSSRRRRTRGPSGKCVAVTGRVRAGALRAPRRRGSERGAGRRDGGRLLVAV